MRRNTKNYVRRTRRINKSSKIFRGGAIKFSQFFNNIFREYFDIPDLLEYFSRLEESGLRENFAELCKFKCKYDLIKTDDESYNESYNKLYDEFVAEGICDAMSDDPDVGPENVLLARVISTALNVNGKGSRPNNESYILDMMRNCPSYCSNPVGTTDGCELEQFKTNIGNNRIAKLMITTISQILKIDIHRLYRVIYLISLLNNQTDGPCIAGPANISVETLKSDASLDTSSEHDVTDITPEEEQQFTIETGYYADVFDTIKLLQDTLERLKVTPPPPPSEMVKIIRIISIDKINETTGKLDIDVRQTATLDIAIHQFIKQVTSGNIESKTQEHWRSAAVDAQELATIQRKIEQRERNRGMKEAAAAAALAAALAKAEAARWSVLSDDSRFRGDGTRYDNAVDNITTVIKNTIKSIIEKIKTKLNTVQAPRGGAVFPPAQGWRKEGAVAAVTTVLATMGKGAIITVSGVVATVFSWLAFVTVIIFFIMAGVHIYQDYRQHPGSLHQLDIQRAAAHAAMPDE